MKPLRLFSSGHAREMVDAFEKLLRERRLANTPEQARLQAMLMHALLFGKPEQAKKILAAGADPNSRFPRGTALGEAINHERPGMVRALLDGGADPNLLSNKKLPLAMACEQGLSAIIHLLVKAGANVKRLGDYMKPALLDAAACGCVPLARKLLDARVPIDFRSKHGRGIYSSAALPRTWQTPLMLAAFYGYREMVEFLIESGADVNLKDGKGHTAMDYARFLKLPNRVRVLKLLEGAEAISSKPFEEAMSGIPDFGQAAKENHFQKALARLTQLTCVKPTPLHQIESPIQGGYGFPITEEKAWKIVKKHHREFLKAGSYLFFTRDMTPKNGPAAALLPTTQLAQVIAAVGTEGPDDNMYNKQVIVWLTRLKQQQPIEILGLGHDFVEGFFIGPVRDAEALARSIAKICSELGDEPAAIRAEAERIQKTRRLFLWWD
jgi:ankyrin repeat protein